MVTTAVVHLDYEDWASGADLQFRATSLETRVLREGNRAGSQWLSLGSSQVAGLVGVPLCLAVVAEARLAALPLTTDSRAGGAAGSDNSKSAIGSRTPPCVGVLGKNPSHHQRLVKQQEAVVLAAEQGDVVGVHSLCALKQRLRSHYGSISLNVPEDTWGWPDPLEFRSEHTFEGNSDRIDGHSSSARQTR